MVAKRVRPPATQVEAVRAPSTKLLAAARAWALAHDLQGTEEAEGEKPQAGEDSGLGGKMILIPGCPPKREREKAHAIV